MFSLFRGNGFELRLLIRAHAINLFEGTKVKEKRIGCKRKAKKVQKSCRNVQKLRGDNRRCPFEAKWQRLWVQRQHEIGEKVALDWWKVVLVWWRGSCLFGKRVALVWRKGSACLAKGLLLFDERGARLFGERANQGWCRIPSTKCLSVLATAWPKTPLNGQPDRMLCPSNRRPSNAHSNTLRKINITNITNQC